MIYIYTMRLYCSRPKNIYETHTHTLTNTYAHTHTNTVIILIVGLLYAEGRTYRKKSKDSSEILEFLGSKKRVSLNRK